jgi:hypothetical protein
MGFGSSPSYTPPPAVPPSAAPPTLASSTVAANAAQQRNATGAALEDFGSSGAQGVSPLSVNTGKNTLGGVS